MTPELNEADTAETAAAVAARKAAADPAEEASVISSEAVTYWPLALGVPTTGTPDIGANGLLGAEGEWSRSSPAAPSALIPGWGSVGIPEIELDQCAEACCLCVENECCVWPGRRSTALGKTATGPAGLRSSIERSSSGVKAGGRGAGGSRDISGA